MPNVEIKRKELLVNGKSVPMISGEVHYWRLNPAYWSDILDQVQGMGLEMVSTYIPWDYHEYAKGKFDFSGKTSPTRNLKAFLALTRKKGFHLILRPGPYIYSEWPNEGAPAYVHQYHRLHPKYLAYAENYLTTVMKVISPYFATRKGGHVVLIQADNEIDPWPDRHGHQYGLAGAPGLFQEFIRIKYHDNLDALNTSWAAHYRSFEEVGPFIATMHRDNSGLHLKGDNELKRNLDYLEFKYEYSNQVASWAVKTYQKLGCDIPIFLNLYPFFYAHNWEQLQKTCDFVGIDFYPTNEFREDAYEHRKFMDKSRYLARVSKLPFIVEFESGVWHNRHYDTGVLKPNHYRLMCLSALLAGITGWNWYMLVNRDNWYMSPINEWGRTRPELYDVFKQMVRIFKKCHPAKWQKISDVSVTYHPIQYAAKTLAHSNPVLVSLYDCDLDYELCNPDLGVGSKPFMFYAGNQWTTKQAQRNLRQYVEKGGTLIAFRDYPRKDDSFAYSSVVGFEEPRGTLFEFKRAFDIQFHPSRPKVPMVSSVYVFNLEDAGIKPVEVETADYGKLTIGYVKKVGKGKIVHLGVAPSRLLVHEILDYLKVPLVCYSLTPDIKTAFFRFGKSYFLVAVNNGTEEKSASIRIPELQAMHRGKVRMHNLLEGTTHQCSLDQCDPFSIQIPAKDGRVIEFQMV